MGTVLGNERLEIVAASDNGLVFGRGLQFGPDTGGGGFDHRLIDGGAFFANFGHSLLQGRDRKPVICVHATPPR